MEPLSASQTRTARAVNVVAGAGLAAIVFWAVVALVEGHHLIATQNLLIGALFAAAAWLNRARRIRWATIVMLTAAHAQVLLGLFQFGYGSRADIYYVALIVAPYLMFERSHRASAHGFAAAGGAAWVLVTALQRQFPDPTVHIDPVLNQLFNTVVVVIGMIVISWGFATAVDVAESSLIEARARADRLLLNVLPVSVADRLKADPDCQIADDYPELTVLFADLVGFTAMSSTRTAAETLDIISEIFTAFDEICEACGAERIKTIGDGYMAVCGAPKARADHALVMVEVARRIRDYMDQHGSLQVRIGLNSGEAVGGVVGRARFHFDLWGDAVNVASRLESTAEVGRIQISASVFEQVREHVACEPRGRVHLKGKGEVETWYVA